MSSRSTGFRWLLTAWLFAALSDGGFANSVIPPPIAAAALLEPVPIKSTGIAAWDKLASEAEAKFAAQNYDAAVVKIRELLAVVGDADKTAPLELLYFKIGLANLLSGRNPEAEAAFNDCLKRFPKDEYTSRCFLGMGRACMQEGNPQIKWRAIAALKTAAKDPQCRPEASLWLGEVYADFGKHEQALAVYRNFMGTEVRTPQQTAAAVAVVRLLADLGRLDELTVQLDRLVRHASLRNSIAWFSNQMVVLGDEFAAGKAYDLALAFYRSVPLRSEVLEIQAPALERMRMNMRALEWKARLEKEKPTSGKSGTSHLLFVLKPAIKQAEECMEAFEDKTDVDAALMLRRGRCLLRLNRYEEALVCFRTIRTLYPDATDAEKAARAEIVTHGEIFTHPNLGNRCAIKLFSDDFLWEFGYG